MPSKRCEAEGCSKWASFNLPGNKRPLYCRPHSTDDMVNVVSRQRCNALDCPKQANFNHPGETRGQFCKQHIEVGMVDVRHKHCRHPGCPKQATCNEPGSPGGVFCGQHKLAGMVNVVLKRCAQDGCETFPSFGHPGQPGVQFCRQHKLPGMTRRTASASRAQQAQPAAPDAHAACAAAAAVAERCAHPGCCKARPLFCAAHQAAHPQPPHLHEHTHSHGTHSPGGAPGQQQPHLSQADHLAAFAALQQPDGLHAALEAGEHLPPEASLGLPALDCPPLALHAGLGEHGGQLHGLPPSYHTVMAEMAAAWQQQQALAHGRLYGVAPGASAASSDAPQAAAVGSQAHAAPQPEAVPSQQQPAAGAAASGLEQRAR